MTRILQIRRGTAAENDNFTGMAGEITMDTTNKTVRVHDGETLGGFALARADEVGAAQEIENFDITSVSADFWQTLFSTYQTTNLRTTSTSLMQVANNAAYYDDSFSDLTELPLYARAFLVCQESDAGYSAGDETPVFGIGDYAAPTVYTYISDYILHVRLFTGSQTFWTPNKTTGAKTNLTPSKWKIKIKVYY